MIMRMVLLAGLLFAANAFADTNADRVRLAGAWVVQNDAGQASDSEWMLEEKGDAMHITYLQGDQKRAEFECDTMGHECESKGSGRHVKVSMWFSGPKLVELETRGSEVIKRRFTVTGQGDTMELEVIPIVPGGRTETKLLKRMQVTAAKQ
jgi:hypothetical protein